MASAEKRVVLTSTRQSPATDVLGAITSTFFAAARAFKEAGDEHEYQKDWFL